METDIEIKKLQNNLDNKNEKVDDQLKYISESCAKKEKEETEFCQAIKKFVPSKKEIEKKKLRLIIIGEPHGSTVFKCVEELVENIKPGHMLIEHPILKEMLEDKFKSITFEICGTEKEEKVDRTEKEKKIGEKIINSLNYKLIISIVGHSYAMENSHIHNMLKKEKISYMTIWKDDIYCKKCNSKTGEKEDICPKCGTKKDRDFKCREYSF